MLITISSLMNLSVPRYFYIAIIKNVHWLFRGALAGKVLARAAALIAGEIQLVCGHSERRGPKSCVQPSARWARLPPDSQSTPMRVLGGAGGIWTRERS